MRLCIWLASVAGRLCPPDMQKLKNMKDFERLPRDAESVGLRLELVRGIPVFEAFPVARHQSAIFRSQSSIRPAALKETD